MERISTESRRSQPPPGSTHHDGAFRSLVQALDTNILVLAVLVLGEKKWGTVNWSWGTGVFSS